MASDRREPSTFERGLSRRQRRLKRTFDLALAVPASVVSAPILLLALVAATIDTRRSGLFVQERIGMNGQSFRVYKIRTMRSTDSGGTTVTRRGDARVTRLGALLRALKIDELPQLLNVLRGEMSIVGPRPDVPGWADSLSGHDRLLLSVRPGVTGPASLAYRHEELMLAAVDDPERYNRDVIWPDKVKINCEYVEHWSLWLDMQTIARTITSVFESGQPSSEGK